MNETIHAARSPEFLSRLYDGEADAAEKAAFETHRARCEECRHAADAFAASLAAFRSSPTAPAAADLSARILRKIRAQSPSRRPFGVMFGIDIRWAGIFVAALLVVLLSAPVLLRRPGAPTPASPSALSARIVDAPAEGTAAPPPPAALRREARPAAPAQAPPAASERTEEVAAAATGPAVPRRDSPEAPAEVERRRFAPAPKAVAQNAAPGMRGRLAPAEPSGGEAGAQGAADAEFRALRLVVNPTDGEGPAPGIVARPSDEQMAALRGNEYTLIVETQGRVRDVQSATIAGKPAATSRRAAGVSAPGELLRELRFAPGDRPRRVVVRIE